MAHAYADEDQNEALLNSLASKATTLRNVTVDIYGQASDHDAVNNASQAFSNMSTSVRGSARRMTRMAAQGDQIAVLKVAGIVIGIGLLVWMLLRWLF